MGCTNTYKKTRAKTSCHITTRTTGRGTQRITHTLDPSYFLLFRASGAFPRSKRRTMYLSSDLARVSHDSYVKYIIKDNIFEHYC